MQEKYPALIDLNVQLGPLNKQEAITCRALLELEPQDEDTDGQTFGLTVRPPRETMRVERGPEGIAFTKGNRMLLFIHRSLIEHLYSPGAPDDD